MTKHNPFNNTDALDEVLLDIATLIELSPRDRRVAENRYRQLKVHLERKGSALAPYLIDGQSLIYAQGSMAMSTTIVSGTDDDRFDVDAIVEFDVPDDWDDKKALDLLEESLKGFPGAIGFERRTRCIQIKFPFMHMDVTVLDRSKRVPVDRAGEIFHAPDKGDAYRVHSNPWGFTGWFRKKVGIGEAGHGHIAEELQRRREKFSKNRLLVDDAETRAFAKADQHDLPPMIPSALDAQQAVALKLAKRYLKLHYKNLQMPWPPTIYVTKRAADVPFIDGGLSVQLYLLANSTAEILREHIKNGTRPLEENPSYPLDKINDRWPRAGRDGEKDMTVLAEAFEALANRLVKMVNAPLVDIAEAIDDMFGERIGKEQRHILTERYDRRNETSPVFTEKRTGAIRAPSIIVTRPEVQEVPRHHFHSFIVKAKDEE